MQQRGRVLAVTAAVAVAAAGVACALPGAQTAWNVPVQLQQANVRVSGAAEGKVQATVALGALDADGNRSPATAKVAVRR
jgi:hypothetical protein